MEVRREVDILPVKQGRKRLEEPSEKQVSLQPALKTGKAEISLEDARRKLKILKRKLGKVKQSRDRWRSRYEESKDPDGEVAYIEKELITARERVVARGKDRVWNILSQIKGQVESTSIILGAVHEAIRKEMTRKKGFGRGQADLIAELELFRSSFESVKSVSSRLEPVGLIGDLKITETGYKYDIRQEDWEPNSERCVRRWDDSVKTTALDEALGRKMVRFGYENRLPEEERQKEKQDDSIDGLDDSVSSEPEESSEEELERERDRTWNEVVTQEKSKVFVRNLARDPRARRLWDAGYDEMDQEGK